MSRIARLKAFLLSCVLVLVITFGGAPPAAAQSLISWDDLQSHSTHLTNPYEELTKEQTYNLSNLYKLKEWVKNNQPAPDSYEIQEIERLEQSFVAEGLDTQELLQDVDQAQAYWDSQSQITNPELEGSAVKLSGYVLPLTEKSSKQIVDQVDEFLLVPFVGACVHVPPPPPNQIIHIKPDVPIDNPGLFSAVQVTGNLRKESNSYELYQVDGSRIVDVSYAMDMDAIGPAPAPLTSKITGPWWQTVPERVSRVLTVSLENLSRQTSPLTLAIAILLSFSYGVLHTLGPGHGKAVIVSYFVGHNGSLKRGLTMGTRIAIFHVFSAVVIAILANSALDQLGANEAGSYRLIRLISYAAIALIGVRMLKQALQRQKRSPSTSPAPLRDATATKSLEEQAVDSLLYPSLSQQIDDISSPAMADCNCLICDDPRGLGDWLALAVGSVPCSGALLVLLYGLANNLFWPSIVMVLAISVGMACTLGWIGAMAIIGNRYGQQFAIRRQTSSWLQRRSKSRFSLLFSGQIIGASCVSLIGVGLFFLTLLTV